MARYIDADALLQEIELLDPEFGNDNSGFIEQGDVLDAIDNCEAADVAPVVHGRWVCKNNQLFPPYCSACLTDSHRKGYTPYYCPFCGAKMDLEAQDDN